MQKYVMMLSCKKYLAVIIKCIVMDIKLHIEITSHILICVALEMETSTLLFLSFFCQCFKTLYSTNILVSCLIIFLFYALTNGFWSMKLFQENKGYLFPYKASIRCILNKSAKNDYLKPKRNEIMLNATQPFWSLLINSQPSCHQVAGDNKANAIQDPFLLNEKLSLKLCKRKVQKYVMMFSCKKYLTVISKCIAMNIKLHIEIASHIF